jgi:RimJ/RimL family protein N-acetyltransferase
VKASRRRSAAVAIGATTAADLRELDALIVKPEVMRGYFGAVLAPRHAREILLGEWQSCQANPAAEHLVLRCPQHGRTEIAGAGFLLEGELRFFVAPARQRQGLGRALVAALRRAAEERQLNELSAWVFPENHASAKLLEACGFTARAAMHVVPYERCSARPVLQYRLSLDVATAVVFGLAAQPRAGP